MARRIIEPLSRKRRIALQVVLWGVLAATVGLAVVVRGALDRSMGIQLGAAQTIGSLRLRLPVGWVTLESEIPGGIWILSHEEAAEEPQEHIEIYHLINPNNLSPQELLLLPIGIPPAYFQRQGPGVQPNPTAGLSKWNRVIEIAGAEGLMREGYQYTRDPSYAWKDVFAAASLPNGQAIIIKLRTLRTPEELESRRETLLVRRVAESISVIHPPRPLPRPMPDPRTRDPREYEEPVEE